MKPWTEIIVRSLGNDQDLFGRLAAFGRALRTTTLFVQYKRDAFYVSLPAPSLLLVMLGLTSI